MNYRANLMTQTGSPIKDLHPPQVFRLRMMSENSTRRSLFEPALEKEGPLLPPSLLPLDDHYDYEYDYDDNLGLGTGVGGADGGSVLTRGGFEGGSIWDDYYSDDLGEKLASCYLFFSSYHYLIT